MMTQSMIPLQRLSERFHKIPAAFRGILFWPWSVPLALLALVVLSYGLRALSMGFFWDDWPYLWLFHSLGPQGIAAGFAQDRPFLSFIYTTTLSLLGTSAANWQIFGLVARWLSCLGFWWALLQVWPGSSHKVFWAAALFAVYPGFSQQWIAIIYGQAFVLYAAVLFSLGITLWLARRRRVVSKPVFWIGTLAALALSIFTMFSTEYFFGLELLRPLLLGLILWEQAEPREPVSWRSAARLAQRILLWWLPYLAAMAAFVVWRGLIHTFPGRGLTVVTGIEKSPLNTLVGLGLTIAVDFVEATLIAWGQTLQAVVLTGWVDIMDLRVPLLISAIAVLSWVYLARLRPFRVQDETVTRRWAVQAVLVGLAAFLAAGWPFWITALPMVMGFPQDRYSLPLSFGLCLLLAGLVDAFGRTLAGKAAVLALAIALACSFHIHNSRIYREDWSNFQDLMWQLTWRAPGIAPNTLLLTADMGLNFYEDDSLTAPLNWTYDPDNPSDRMNYLLYDLLVRQYTLMNQNPGVAVQREFRGKTFTGSTSQVLVIAYDPPGCLKVLDPVYDVSLPRLPERVLRVLPLSSPQQWVDPSAAAASPPYEIFGSEPRRRWCYYYEKASLARQAGDWQEIVRLAGESIRQGIRPERSQDEVEFLPFIEAYARVGRWDDATQMTVDVAFWAPDAQPALCALWRRNLQGEAASEARQRALQQVNERLLCNLP